MSDRMHNHLTLGLRPPGKCPACDQTHRDLLKRRALVKS